MVFRLPHIMNFGPYATCSTDIFEVKSEHFVFIFFSSHIHDDVAFGDGRLKWTYEYVTMKIGNIR